VKGLLLAGGHGTRLRPLTFAGNKHMIPIANRPMLHYGLENLERAGIRDVGIILGPIHEGIREALGDGAAFGVRITYIVQGEPKGLAHAIACAREFLGDEPFVMHLGDNLLQGGVGPIVRRFETDGPDAVISVTRVPDARAYGVVELDGERIVSIVEKPDRPRSDLALVGVYLFTPRIHGIVAGLRPSARGELEVTEAIWQLHQSGARLAVHRVDGWWKDTGKPDDLLEANEFVLRTRTAWRVDGTVHPGAVVQGPVDLGAGAIVDAGARVDGPAVIGPRARLRPGTVIGPSTAIGTDVEIDGASIRRSIVMDRCRVRGRIRLADSILGRDVELVGGAAEPAAEATMVLGDAARVRL